MMDSCSPLTLQGLSTIGQPPLQAKPQFETEPRLPIIVSLFSGAGGLDLGFKQEGFEIGIAFDIASASIRTHKRNFPKSVAISGDLTQLRPSGVLGHVMSAIPIGSRIGIIGGPPCQGFSRANVGSKEKDPRNELPKLYVRIVRALQRAYRVEFVVFENVLGIRDVKHAHKYKNLVRGLRRLNLHVSEQELYALEFGVPQIRRRIVLAGVPKTASIPNLRPRRRTGAKSVRDAIGGLPPPVFFSRDLTAEDIPFHPNHWTMNPLSPRFQRGAKKPEARSFKRLSWSKPCPTIAFGHREIHVHPTGRRRLSIFEAMLLQGFPKTFVLEGNLSEQVEQVSNAVPPPLARSLASALRRELAKRVRR
jgi:DNA (cytosine-5)-methyltransferase 1